jgi:hypothetical protein
MLVVHARPYSHMRVYARSNALAYVYAWCHQCSAYYEFTLQQLRLIWPWVPVSGWRFPIFTMAVAKALVKAAALDAKFRTMLSVLPLLKSSWSECRSPLWDSRLL